MAGRRHGQGDEKPKLCYLDSRAFVSGRSTVASPWSRDWMLRLWLGLASKLPAKLARNPASNSRPKPESDDGANHVLVSTTIHRLKYLSASKWFNNFRNRYLLILVNNDTNKAPSRLWAAEQVFMPGSETNALGVSRRAKAKLSYHSWKKGRASTSDCLGWLRMGPKSLRVGQTWLYCLSIYCLHSIDCRTFRPR